MMNLMIKRTGIFGSVTARHVAVLCTLAMVAMSQQGCGVYRHQDRQVNYVASSKCKSCVYSKVVTEGKPLARNDTRGTGPYASGVSVVGDSVIVSIMAGQQCSTVQYREDTLEYRQTVRKKIAGAVLAGVGAVTGASLLGASAAWSKDEPTDAKPTVANTAAPVAGLMLIIWPTVAWAMTLTSAREIDFVGWYDRDEKVVELQHSAWESCDKPAIPLNYTVALTAADGVSTALYRIATPDTSMRLPGYYLPAAFWQNPKWTLTVSQDANTPGGSSTPRPVQITVAGDLSAPAASRTAWEEEQQRAAQKKQAEEDDRIKREQQYRVAIENLAQVLGNQKNACRDLYVGQAVSVAAAAFFLDAIPATVVGIGSAQVTVRTLDDYQTYETDCPCIIRNNETSTTAFARRWLCNRD